MTPDDLLALYARGVFPMAEARDSSEIFLVEPQERAVLPLNQFHLPHSLRRRVRQNIFEVRINKAFDLVLAGCAGEGKAGYGLRPESWINSDIKRLYQDLHRLGYAHSVETWHQDQLVGGLYGLVLGGIFFGESMFSYMTDASKVALVHLVARLGHGGFSLIDCQFMTEHLRRFGVIAISKAQYQKCLAEALSCKGADFFSMPETVDGAYVLQVISQRS